MLGVEPPFEALGSFQGWVTPGPEALGSFQGWVTPGVEAHESPLLGDDG